MTKWFLMVAGNFAAILQGISEQPRTKGDRPLWVDERTKLIFAPRSNKSIVKLDVSRGRCLSVTPLLATLLIA